MTNLANLSHIDFEELCIDIIQKETQERFSSFGPGADGGIDGRHSKGDNLTIIQCKHYIRSNSSDLIRAAAKELPKIQKLGANKYIFLTSYSLTPALSDRLQAYFLHTLRMSKSGVLKIFRVLLERIQISLNHI